MEILEFKCIITKMKNSLDKINIRFEQEEERISKIEDRSVMKNQKSLRDLWGNQIYQQMNYRNPRRRGEKRRQKEYLRNS